MSTGATTNETHGAWAALLPVTMVGTDRHTGTLPNWPGAVGALIAEVTQSAPDPASAILRASAVLELCQRAGAQGSPWPNGLPRACASDPRHESNDAALIAQMAWIWREGPARVQHELCALLARAGQRLPASLLPLALEQGRRSVALRADLLPVLGTRGLWLAAHRDDWQYAAGVAAQLADETRWTHGTTEQRREFLVRERDENPDAARDRFALALPEMNAKERVELLGALTTGLSDADASLLDSLRTDRSREVRQLALRLLLRLPAAAHPMRAAQRMAGLVFHERAGLLKRWVVHAPEVPDEGWKTDNLETVRPQHDSLGERAWWLYQLVRQVPLGWWTRHMDMTPAQLLRWASGCDWGEPVLRGWRDVLFAAPDHEWCRALLADWPAKGWSQDSTAVLALLPAPEREAYWHNQLIAGQSQFAELLAQVLSAWPMARSLSRPLSESLAQALAQLLRASIEAATRDHYHLVSQIPDLCCVLHPDALEALAQLLRSNDEAPGYFNTLQTAMRVIAARRALHSHFST